jgi:hypothetical protein
MKRGNQGLLRFIYDCVHHHDRPIWEKYAKTLRACLKTTGKQADEVLARPHAFKAKFLTRNGIAVMCGYGIDETATPSFAVRMFRKCYYPFYRHFSEQWCTMQEFRDFYWPRRSIANICLGFAWERKYFIAASVLIYVARRTGLFGKIARFVTTHIHQPRVLFTQNSFALLTWMMTRVHVATWLSEKLGLLDFVGEQLADPEARILGMNPITDCEQAYRRAVIAGTSNQRQIRQIISSVAARNNFQDPIMPRALDAMVREIAAIGERYPGAMVRGAIPVGRPLNGPNKPCLFCDLQYRSDKGSNGRFVHRICQHHNLVIYDRRVPGFECGEMRLAMEGYATETGLSIGPYVTTTRDLPLPNMQLFPLTNIFGRKAPTVAAMMDNPCEFTETKTAVLVGYGFGRAPIWTAGKGMSVTVKAICCRIGRMPRKQPQQSSFNLAQQVYRHLFLFTNQVTAMATLDWVKTVRRKEDMLKTIEELKTAIPVDFMNPIWKLFVKMEKSCAVEFIDGDFNPITDFKPRAIQAPPDWVHVLLGPHLKTCLHQIETVFVHTSHIFYAGCATPPMMNEWLHTLSGLNGYVFLCIDYKMFDCTHSDISFDFAEDIYKMLVDFSPELAELLRRLRIPSGQAGKVKYKAPKPMNGSGRPDTSLVNIVNSIAALIVTCAHLIFHTPVDQITLDQCKTAIELVYIGAAGDDSVVALPTVTWINGVRRVTLVNKTSIENAIGTFGFDAPADKVTICSSFSEVVFLGHRPYPVGGRWYWGPTLARRLYKHHTMLTPHGDLRAWLHGVAQMEAQCYPHVPVLYDMALSVLSQLQGHKINLYHDKEARYKAAFCSAEFSPPPYDESTVAFVEDLYNVPRGSVEDFKRTLGPIPCMLNHYLIDAMMAVDEM